MRISVTLATLILPAIFATHAHSDPLAQEMLAPLDLSSPEATAYSMMRAMYQGDAEMVDQVFAPGGQLRRVTNQGELRPDGFQGWRDWVSTLAVGDAHEVLFGVETETYGTLATVWAPFTITVKGDLVGCGVNQLTMANTDGNWRVVFGMDTHAPKESCADFKTDYLAASH